MARLDIEPDEVVHLWLEEELSIKEIAQRCDCGITTVKNRLYEARVRRGDAWWRECRRERAERRRARREERAREAYRLRSRSTVETEKHDVHQA